MFLTVGGDAQGHDEALIAQMHAVDQQRDQVEAIERRALARPRAARWCRRRSAADGARAGFSAGIAGPSGSRLCAYWRVAKPTSISSTTRRSSASVAANI